MKNLRQKYLISRMVTVFLLMMGISTYLFAQTGTITGRVTEAKTGELLAAANIIIEGTNLGASADIDGNYTINNVPAGSYTITAVYIGYKSSSKSVQVSDGLTTVDFQLKSSVLNMDELIITATGIRRKVEIANSISRINAIESVKARPLNDISGLLQGQAAGVQISESGGSVGMGSSIRIRGTNSASLNNEPVIYIDGVLINNQSNSISFQTGGQSPSRLNDINPEDIESIEIIKGPSAATLYGSVAANGVVLITTKRGRMGRPRWTAYTETGVVNDIGDYPKNFQAFDASGNPVFNFDVADDASLAAVTINSFQPLNDSRTSPFRTGQSVGLGLSVSGGSESLTYYLSGNYTDSQGVLEVSNIRRVNFRGNFGSQVSDNLQLNLTTGYTSSDLELPLNDNFALGLMGQGLNGSATSDVNDGWGEFTPAELFTIDTQQNIDRFTTGLEAKWDPSESLNFRAAGGVDFTSRWDNQFFPTGEAPAFLNYDQGARFSNRFNEFVYTLDLLGSYKRALSESFKSRTSVGFQYLQNLLQGTESTGLQLVAGSSSIAGAATTTSIEQTIESRTVGVFVEERITYRDKLYLSGALRADQGSSFGATNEAVVYPKLGASWLISDESFFKVGWLSSFRLRAAWGESGVQPGTTDALRFFNPIAATVDGGQNVTGVSFGGVGNADLIPERSSEVEVGADATLFSDRLGVEITYFNKQTEDALIFRQLPLSLGVGGGRFENLGSVSNTGFEFALNSTVFDNGSTSLNLNFIGAVIDNELTELGEGIEPVIFGLQRHVEGKPLGGYWDEDYTFSDANGDGLIGQNEVQLLDADGDGTPDAPVFLGSSFAKTDISINGTFGLLGDQIVVRALLNYRGGQKLYNNTGAWRNGNSNTDELNDPNASLAGQARAVASKFLGSNAGYIEDASFWRLREVSLTYNAPRKWSKSFGVSSLSLTLSGRNLGLWTDYSGLDPEISSNGQGSLTGRPRTGFAGQGAFTTQEFLSQPPVRSWKARINITY